jgi:hypothetical protein
MHVISLYLVLNACATTFDMMCVQKIRGNQTGLRVCLDGGVKFLEAH